MGIYDVCVVSFGGVGCTSLMKVLRKFLRTNDVNDKDGLKHGRTPNLPIYQKHKINSVIYVYNNPINAVLSIYRRNFQKAQYKKLTGKNMDEDIKLDEYIESEIDIFMLERHFDNWKAGCNRFPILMVNSAKMYQTNNLKKILNFLKLRIPLQYFQQKPRKSNYKNLDAKKQQKIKNTYNQLMDKMDKLNNVQVVPKKTDPNLVEYKQIDATKILLVTKSVNKSVNESVNKLSNNKTPQLNLDMKRQKQLMSVQRYQQLMKMRVK